MKVAYITAHTPYGHGETFVLEEMLMMAELGVDLIIVPRNPPKEVFHQDAQKLLGRTVWLPLLNWQILWEFLKAILLRPRLWRILWAVVRNSRSLKILVKNLAVLPKAVFIAKIFQQEGVEHIHAHWGSTTATMAWAISEITRIPWSFTLHRWDIAENNMLTLKIERSVFARCISEDGRNELLRMIGKDHSGKVKVLHLGVHIPEILPDMPQETHQEFVIACPANFVPKKGHRFLIEACALLLEAGVENIRCLLIGDGPLVAEIRDQVRQLRLEKVVHFMGRLPHRDLLAMYRRGEVDAVVLPSIVTPDGEKEGIPVALMEAMAYGIPVISTQTGGIPELLGEGAGIIVPPASSRALAEAIQQLMGIEKLRKEYAQKGYMKVKTEFNIKVNAQKLIDLMTVSGRGMPQ